MNDLNWIVVSSTNVSRVAYDDVNQYLYVEFLNGSMYLYKNVPSNEFDLFLQATSQGTYLAHHIKPHYPVERI